MGALVRILEVAFFEFQREGREMPLQRDTSSTSDESVRQTCFSILFYKCMSSSKTGRLAHRDRSTR